ncbi:hypothetical protein [Dysgonomonas gadei]|uniref:HTH cro/C1-type domain-containing protein n=1 Tax=Dysgonomonas gadei ATCC BAA-286 TaxID=742766 RepID=F5J196_9BACT|nr:hypothetical protein [Dysgonomonas gadei]EGK00470.1 hypothetical protein HMPREF9455_03113 [Dysgonomonas gadei ATCC BAA-286]
MIERIEQFVEYLGISVRAFEQKIGASNGLIRKAITNKSDIQSKWISIIVDRFPQINTEWLLIGKGPMLKIDSENTVNISEEKLISNLIKEGKVMYCSEHDRQIKYKDAVIAELNQEIGKLKTLLEQNGIKQTGTLG